jgi:hypothetical protein
MEPVRVGRAKGNIFLSLRASNSVSKGFKFRFQKILADMEQWCTNDNVSATQSAMKVEGFSAGM